MLLIESNLDVTLCACNNLFDLNNITMLCREIWAIINSSYLVLKLFSIPQQNMEFCKDSYKEAVTSGASFG